MDRPAEENPYRSPQTTEGMLKSDFKALPHCDKIIRKLLFRAIIQTFVTLIIASLILDGGEIAKRWALALAASWVATLLIILRYHFGRSHLITRFDAIVIKFSVYPIFIAFLILEDICWKVGFFR
jgi:hypothetical protein